MPLKKNAVDFETEKRILPRHSLNLYERNEVGKKYLEGVYKSNEKKSLQRNKNKKFEVLDKIRSLHAKEAITKEKKWEKQKNHMEKYDQFIRLQLHVLYFCQ